MRVSRQSSLLGAVVVLAGLITGCPGPGGTPDGGGGGSGGGSGGGGGGSGGYVTGQAAVDLYNTQVCPNLPGALCDYLVRCGSMHATQSCQDFMSAYSTAGACDPQQIASLKDSRSEIDSSRIASCLDAIRTTASCTAFSDIGALPQCTDVFRGRVAAGGSCYSDNDCVPEDYCSAITTSTCPGTCAVRKAIGDAAQYSNECGRTAYLYGGKCTAQVALNGSCAPISPSTSQQDCVPGAYCNASDVCVPEAGANAACSTGAAPIPCATYLQCVTAAGSNTGTCKPPATLSASCSLGGGNPGCQWDLYCDLTSLSAPGTCKTPEVANGPCLFDQSCRPGLYCEGESLITFTKGACLARIAQGQQCTGTGGTYSSNCASGLYCSATCQALKADGATCADHGECQSGDCVATHCAPAACMDPTP